MLNKLKIGFFFVFITACQPVKIDEIEVANTPVKRTVLKVGTLYGPQIYLKSEHGESGFDFEMAQRFAEFLDVELQMVPFNDRSHLFSALKNQQIDLIAAGISKTPTRAEQFKLGPTLYYVNQVLVYKAGHFRPRDISQLSGKVMILPDSAAENTLINLQSDFPKLHWQTAKNIDYEALLAMVVSGELDYTVIDSNSLLISQRFLPELREAMTLEEKTEVTWLLPADSDDSLMSQLLTFWHQQKRAGTFEYLDEKYFGHVKRFDYVDTRAFIRAIDNVLPEYQNMFEKYAGTLDWRKLAATSYQESHWNPKARSPTGVRGMMMLTRPTASYVGVKNRLDAEQSIRGGAKYLQNMLDRLPESIPDNQRTWFALASYNVGLGHVEDARKMAQSMGLDPSAWRDVKKVLPLLQQSKYYKQTRYGYARGGEAVYYVDNIRRYYDTLVWVDNQTKQLNEKNNLDAVPDGEIVAEEKINPILESAQ
ncbi:membrane-bound lytic murein transglycosylase MltF [Shewanella intestini]|uniref:Membrane-bound lytic murein transglycosylase F n=1 Tax=Shewanella intestini TaxID=2017544 RepID=A0ABS5I4K9_9GAMM|nr:MULTISPECIES: membrane-bound lytic murein transglycosylase MltF [Shewanella]MBR9728240.1 membrane-bound lytic murein transglycosylase MltF [Shewanella intestini]MRG35705.1 membrane-bound lytic murein transglycosylase MltF [Shewanella sp. XMDDZSB0408]